MTPLSAINFEKTKALACATVIEEMLPHMPPGMTYEVLDFGLHLKPGTLKQALQDAIDAAGAQFDTVLLGYGLCSMAAVGLQAHNCRLILPRVDDCIAIFLGSKDAYDLQIRKAPGTYYLTKGWIEVADTPFGEYERLVEKYGQERADWVMQTMLKNYTRLVYIDTGVSEKQRYVDYTRRTAERFKLKFEEIEGSDALIRKMLFGPWEQDFIVAEPGHVITYLDFKPGDLASPPPAW